MASQTVKLNLDTREFDRGIGRVTAALGAIVGLATIRKVAQLADEFQQVNARLKLATGGGEAFIRAQKRLNALSAQTRSGLSETTDLFSRLARSTTEAGTSQEKLLTVTETINKAIKVSGASAQEANAAIIQLGQGLSSGALRGDELRSVLEQTPRLAQAIAAGLGVTIGELRKLGGEGKLTTQVVLDALENQAPKIREEFKKIPPTIADAFTELNNQVLRSTETLNKGGFGSLLQGIAKGFGDTLDAVSSTINNLLPEKDLQALTKRVRIGFNDIIIGLLTGFKSVEKPVKMIFNVVSQGLNNLFKVFNALPPEAQAIGIIGYFLIGRSVKLIILAVVLMAKEIARILDVVIKNVADAIDFIIKGFNKARSLIGKDPIELIDYDPTKMQNLVADMGIMDGLFDMHGEKLELIEGLQDNQVSNTQKVIDKLRTVNKVLKEGNKIYDDQILRQNRSAKDTIGVGKVSLDEGPDAKALEKIRKRIEKEFKTVQEGLMSEEQLAEQSHVRKIKAVQDYYGEHFRNVSEAQRMIEALERKHQDNLERIGAARIEKALDQFRSGKLGEIKFNEMAEKDKIEFAKKAGMQLLEQTAQHNKAAFMALKALKLKEAIIQTASGVLNALGSSPPPLNFILAGLVGAAGAAQIATIASQQYQGRAGGGSVSKGTPYVVGEAGPEMFLPNQSGTIIPNKNMGGSGPVEVNFHIEATDASSVDAMLMERRGMITNIIREAMEESGQRSIV